MQCHRLEKARGFTVVEWLIVVALLGILLSIAIPNLMNALEAAVIRQVQIIHQAQMQHRSQFGTYAATLAELGPSGNREAGPGGANLIPSSLASGEKNGYVFGMTRTAEGFVVIATPKVFGATGRRTFYIDQGGVVRHNWDSEPATAGSPEIK